eukprot:CAMPEP_0115036794 /NCGR_PEP_ID=MMETSP0216-20121206/42353_1 /TAXON_ID=223996 /ORGANISM="Protocruzia adherens, Strain Boccale" /LENGTH=98 /DNA_ID=CAMNT_0002416727 /DNA_START=335 /DNA_END=630 /DNA_ORIENTATION=+
MLGKYTWSLPVPPEVFFRRRMLCMSRSLQWADFLSGELEVVVVEEAVDVAVVTEAAQVFDLDWAVVYLGFYGYAGAVAGTSYAARGGAGAEGFTGEGV